MKKFKGAVRSLQNVDGPDYYTPHIYGFNHMLDVDCPRIPGTNCIYRFRTVNKVSTLSDRSL